MNKKLEILGMLMILASVFFASTYGIFGKILLDHVSPETLTLIAQIISVSILLFVYGFIPEIRKIHLLPNKTLIILLIFAMIGGIAVPLLFLKGLELTFATNALILGKINPVVLAFLSVFWLKEKMNRFQVIGTIFMFIGVLYVATQAFTLGLNLQKGDLLIVIGASLGATATALFKKYLSDVSVELTIIIRNTVGAMFLLLIVPFILDFSHSFEALQHEGILLTLFCFALCTIIFTQFFWYRGLDMVKASTASTIDMLGPIFGITMAVLILGEELFAYHIVGFLIIFLGLGITTYHKNQKKHPHHKRHLSIRNFFHH